MNKSNKTGILMNLLATEAKAVNVNEGVVREECTDGCFPVVYRKKLDEIDLKAWIKLNRERVNADLLRHGAVLFRGFGTATADEFSRVFELLAASPLKYTERTSPRKEITDGVYSSTEHPADQIIYFHNELSYARSWPLKIAFCCLQPPAAGGETPLADVGNVYRLLDAAIVEKFSRLGVMYTRNVVQGIGLGWREVFQTDDPAVAEAYCRDNGIGFRWMSPDHLRMNWVRPAIRRHPVTGQAAWFNHGYFYHASNLEASTRRLFSEADLPFQTHYGDGSAIEDHVLAALRSAYDQSATQFQWQASDFLLLDNMRIAHGRNAFRGDRKILVAMGDLQTE